MSLNFTFRTPFYLYLPLICSVLLESHLHFLSRHGANGSLYIQIVGQLFIESSPFFIAHYIASIKQRNQQVAIWSLGFLCYPVLLFLMNMQISPYNDWALLSVQGWLFSVLASAAWFVNRALKTHNKTRSIRLVSQLFSLNTVLMLLLLGWAIIMAGIFNSHQNNQSLNAVIDVMNILTEFSQFLNFLWQFLVVATLIGCVYAINRYGLIRQVLAKQGVLAFSMAALVCIIIVTPIFASVVLLLPLNSPNITLFPSDNHQLFAPVNYQFSFWLFAISTPLILAFERQRQYTVLAQTSHQKIDTELKLLQQQINPHFLFNTLNNLYALTLIKSDDAPHLLMKLSNLLRFTIYEGQKEFVTLTQEVAYLQGFIDLQQIRSKDKLRLDLKWPEHDKKFILSPLLIIMLLENAFKHGVEPAMTQSYIRFHMQLNDNILSVVCENTFCDHTQYNTGGIGLDNLRRRLALLYPGRHDLKSAPRNGVWCAEMTLELTL